MHRSQPFIMTAFLFLTLTGTGCAIDLSESFFAQGELESLNLPADRMGPGGAGEAAAPSLPVVPFYELNQAAYPKRRPAPHDGGFEAVVAAPNDRDILPDFVRREPAVQKYIKALDAAMNGPVAAQGALESAAAPKKPRKVKLNLTGGDIRSLTTMVTKSLVGGATRQNLRKAKNNAFLHRVYTYLFAHFTAKDGFVTRTGKQLKPADFSGDVSNDHIVPVVAIFMEALTDELIRSDYHGHRATFPVLMTVDGSGYAVGKNRPTVSRYQEKIGKPVDLAMVEAGVGITPLEFKGIKFLSGLASDNSTVLSGMIVRTLGDIEVAFVVGPHFSFGDNETFAKVVDTTVNVAVRQAVEAGAIHLARKVTTSEVEGAAHNGLERLAEEWTLE